MYKAQAEANTASAQGAEANPEQPKDEKVVDADFEEVK